MVILANQCKQKKMTVMRNLFANRILVLSLFILFVVVANAQMQFMPEFEIEQTSFIQSSTISSVFNESTETKAVATSTNSGSTFAYVTTGINHTIFVPINSVSFDGQPIMTGDKIGVFYLKSGTHKCGGYTEVTNPLLNITVTAWGDDPATTNKDGFEEGEELIWKIYRDTAGITYTADAGYSAGLPNQQFYQTNGLSALTSLAVISTGVNWTYSITGNNHSILLPAGAMTIEGQLISAGDKVGVFFYTNLGLMCGGFTTIQNPLNISVLAAWGNDVNSPVKIGFDVGEVFKWKIFQSSTGITYEAVATYGTNFSNGDTYAVNGISGITSLTTVVSNVQWTYTNTGNNHVIMIPANTVFVNGQGLNAGDMVGVFYHDSTVLKCGGYRTIVNPNQNATVAAWGDDTGSPVKDGFAIGESFQWKIFRLSDNTVYDAVPVYNYSFAHGGEYVVNGLSGLESLTTAGNSYQALMLMQGWSFISTYIIPDDNNIENLFQSVMNDIIIIKNGDGAVFWPMFGVDMIDSLSIGEGYQLKMQNTDSIVVQGTIIIPENTSINIPFGWSILGYLRQIPGNLATLLAPIMNKIIICKNDAGQVFWPQFNLDQISDMVPGEGYLIKMSSAAIYSYPANQNLPCSPQPSQAMAPADSLNVVADSVLLEATTPSQGSGEWTVISGTGGYFSEGISPSSYFFGNQGETYQLLWSVSNNCGSTSDTVVVSFYDPANYECGMPWLDTRDNKYYNTVEIGFQCWMAENLNYGNFIPDSTEAGNNSIPEKYCYDNNLNFCESHGGLYRWAELMEYSAVEGSRGICPNGWHIPSDAEWYILEHYIDTTINDPNAVGYRGIDAAAKLLDGGSSGLDLLFAGMYAGGGNFYGMNPNVAKHSSYASSTENPANINNAWRRILFENENGIGREASSKYYSISVRCITDDTVSCAPQPSLANAGDDRISINNETVALGAGSPVYGIGQWAILEGQNGTVAQPANPSSPFTGVLGETYKLAWTVTNNCGSTSDSMMIYLLNDSDMVCGGLFPDLRDNSVYPTIQLGNQCWMTTNLDYGNYIDGSVDPLNNGLVEKYCYEDEEANCEILGGMYRWNELMEYTNSEQAQGICPDGWHIPSDYDWYILENFVDTSINIPASTGFRGTDAGTKLISGGSTGLNIQLSGIYAGNNNYYGVRPNLPHYGYYASSTTNASNVNKTWMRIFHQNEVGVMRDFDTKYYGISVRCLANNANPCFIQPTQANAGPDQTILANDSTQLLANIPVIGTGTWSIASGMGGNFSDSTLHNPFFYGTVGESYQLVWTITNSCGMKSDAMMVYFVDTLLFSCGNTYFDYRDGQAYGTVEINGLCWMTENLNYGTYVSTTQGQSDNSIPEKYCYANNIAKCSIFGGLYTWNEIMQYDTVELAQGICPTGWHVPSDTEWFELENFEDSTVNDPTATGYRGTDVATKLMTGGSSGLEIIYSGIFYQPGGTFYGAGSVNRFASYATSTESGANTWFRTFSENYIGVSRSADSKLFGLAVRCVKN